MEQIEIQGIVCSYRSKEEGEFALYENLPQDEQYFKRVTSPFTDDELINIANREHNYTDLQKKWVADQKALFGKGLYAYINGVLTFIPGAYWAYVNFWTLEHGEKPEYREDDRLFFLFHEYLRLETNALGLARLKGRRQGATSIAMFFMWFIGGRQEHALCGTTSFNDDAAAKNFSTMFVYGFKAMLPCFQEDFDTDSDKFIRFVKPVDKKKKGVLAVKREGLNSYCDFMSNTINSYDSGRQTYNVPDEWGKRQKLDFNSYWSRLYKTFLVGSNKVGFAYLPSTMAAKKEGGENGKLFWRNANQYAIDRNTGKPVGINTSNRVVRYFVPATLCYSGYIDKFGKSIVEDPSEPVLTNEGKYVTEGSRTVILRERERLEGNQLMEHRRDYPLDEYDAFAFETGSCEFIEKNLIDRIQFLDEHPDIAFWRQGRLYTEYDDNKKMIVKFADDHKGEWFIKEFPMIENAYKVSGGGQHEALNTLAYSGGADTYKNIFADEGSEGVVCITSKSRIVGGEEKGLLPVAFFVGRPRLIRQFNEQVFLGSLWYGCKINYEIDAGSWFWENFLEWNATGLLEWTPAIDLTNKNFKIKPGTESGNPFQLAKQLEVAKMYYDGTSIEKYNGQVHRVTFAPLLKDSLAYNHSERTPHHLTVAFMMSLLPILSQTRPPRPPQERKIQIMPTYKIKV
jgi:hypothetical protein